MNRHVEESGGFRYLDMGSGQPIVLLHGLMGTLSNFAGVLDFFPQRDYRILLPDLPFYSMPIKKTTVSSLCQFVYRFLEHLDVKNPVLLGNSLGGHIALIFARDYLKLVKGLVITGSSGLYENNISRNAAPNRKNYQYIKSKAEEVFYDPKVATKEIVDDVFAKVNDNKIVIRTIALAKSALRHNMSEDLKKMNVPTAIIWGKQDIVTPPEVAIEFNNLLPDADLFWIDKCGHAPMMEHPQDFNLLLFNWLRDRDI